MEEKWENSGENKEEKWFPTCGENCRRKENHVTEHGRNMQENVGNMWENHGVGKMHGNVDKHG